MRPWILWGLDPAAHAVAEAFAASLPAHASGVTPPAVFAKPASAIPEFREFVLSVREDARVRFGMIEPAVVLLAAAHVAESSRSLSAIREVSGALGAVQQGNQTITLVVLTPPASASGLESQRTYDFFLGLEAMAGETRYLTVIFVNRLDPAAHEQLAACCAAQDGTGGFLFTGDELLELLRRELADPETENLIQAVGHSAVGHRSRVGGRKCCYSTAGFYALRYPQREALRHLLARFQADLFDKGLMDADSITKEDRRRLQRRADDFIRRREEEVAGILPARLPDYYGPALKEPTPAPAAAGKIASLEKEIDRPLAQARPKIDRAIKTLDGCARKEISSLLAAAPKHLAEAAVYVEALRGNRLLQDPELPEGQPSGGRLFETEFCFLPQSRSVFNFFKEQLGAILVIAGGPVPPGPETETPAEFLARAVEEIEARLPALEESQPGNACHARFFTSAYRMFAGTAALGPGAARSLGTEAAALFCSESARIYELIQAKEKERGGLQEDVRSRFHWFRRNITARQEYRGLMRRMAGLELEEKGFRSTHVAMHLLLEGMLNRLVLPQIVRAEVNGKLQDEIESAASAFEAFALRLGQQVSGEWEAARNVPQHSTTTGTTILDDAALAALYENTLKGERISDYAARMLRFLPASLQNGDEPLSYRLCRNLGDHYEAGARSLADRMRDYAAETFSPVLRLHVLDILELRGADAATFYLQDRIDKTRQFLEFSPGLMTRVRREGRLREILIVRSAGRVNTRLSASYAGLFRPADLFLDNGDPFTLHFTCLMFGFPAFVLHTLEDARKAAISQYGAQGADLWPVDCA